MDHYHVVNQVTEKPAEYTKPLYIAYEKAFDSELPAVILEAVKVQGL